MKNLVFRFIRIIKFGDRKRISNGSSVSSAEYLSHQQFPIDNAYKRRHHLHREEGISDIHISSSISRI